MANTAAICSERGGQLNPGAARPALCRETKALECGLLCVLYA